jgi:hypothetical protein
VAQRVVAERVEEHEDHSGDVEAGDDDERQASGEEPAQARVARADSLVHGDLLAETEQDLLPGAKSAAYLGKREENPKIASRDVISRGL